MPLKHVEGWFRAHSVLLAFTYLLFVPGAIIALAAVATINLTTNQRQDRIQSQQIRENHDLIRQLETVRFGVCALRREREAASAELKPQIARAERFLRDHPSGLPSLGVTASQLQASIVAQKTALKLEEGTVQTLRVVKCPKGTG